MLPIVLPPRTLQLTAVATGLLLITHLCHATLLYQVVTPDGRTVTVNDPTKAYQLNPDTSKITVIDTDALPNSLPNNLPSDLSSHQANPSPTTTSPAATSEAPITYNTTRVTNGDTTTTTTTVTQPLVTEPTAPPAMSEFEELNISSTRASKQGDYRLAIMTPAADALYRKPAQTIDITLTLTPALKKGDTINLAIDGHVIKNGTQLTYQIPTTDIAPDKHTLQATIINVLNKPIASATTTFYLVQNNPLIQKQRQLAKQMAAYEALPWYEKLKLRLGFEDKKVDMSNALNPAAKK